MHKPNHSIQNFNDGATRLANVAVVLSTSREVTFSDVDDKNLKQLLLAQWSFGARDPLQDVVDYCPKFWRHLFLYSRDKATVSADLVSCLDQSKNSSWASHA